jgi:hypothetical protein
VKFLGEEFRRVFEGHAVELRLAGHCRRDAAEGPVHVLLSNQIFLKDRAIVPLPQPLKHSGIDAASWVHPAGLLVRFDGPPGVPAHHAVDNAGRMTRAVEQNLKLDNVGLLIRRGRAL